MRGGGRRCHAFVSTAARRVWTVVSPREETTEPMSGYDIRTVQEIFSNKNVQTTMNHGGRGVQSPMGRL
jgi:hypothetical protein